MHNSHNLVTISPESHNVLLEIAYATRDNFTGEPIYQKPVCLLHKEAAKRLSRAVETITPLGLRLKIWDAFRPLEAQKMLFEHTPNPIYIGDPAVSPCPHCRGIAIDLTLTDQYGKELIMGTAFDDFRPLAHHGNNQISREAQKNRLLLAGVMNIAGFDTFDTEWWHYQLPDANNYPLLKEADIRTGIIAL